MQPNNTAQTHMVKPDVDKTHMVRPEDGIKIPKHPWEPATLIKQVTFDTKGKANHPGDLPPIPEGRERIYTIKGVHDGRQIYSENCILDVDPGMAEEMCDKVFEGSHAHVGDSIAEYAQKHQLRRAVRIKEFMKIF